MVCLFLMFILCYSFFMKTSKKLSINLAPLFSTTNNKSSVDLSKLNFRYKNSQISNSTKAIPAHNLR